MLRWYWIRYVWRWVPGTERWHERKIAKHYFTHGPGRKPTPEEFARLRKIGLEQKRQS